MWCADDFLAVAAEVPPAQIIGEDENDIGRARRGGGGFHPDAQACNEDTEQE
jgi:hypothetical protein